MIRTVTINGKEWEFSDHGNARSVDLIAYELNCDCYGLSRYTFRGDEVVIDIGANTGVVSIPLAAANPTVAFLLFEPYPATFPHLRDNLARYSLNNTSAFPVGVTSDGRSLHMQCNLSDMTGGATACLKNKSLPGATPEEVETLSIHKVFGTVDNPRVFLKIDCEGMEHEILSAMTDAEWGRVCFLAAEFHENDFLREQGYSNVKLVELVRKHLPESQSAITCIEMANE